MSSSLFIFVLFAVSLSLFVAVVRLLTSSRREKLLPPGPQGSPIAGNALQVPGEYQWLYFSNLRKQYGDLASVTVFGRPMIIVNSRSDMLEITGKRSDNYNERPHVESFDLSGWGRATAVLNGPDWKDHRRYMARFFGTRPLVQKFFGLEVHEARKFMRNILRSADDLEHHIRHFSGSLILKIIYGHNAQEGHDPFIEKVDEAMAQFSELLKLGTFIVDFLPWLQYLPDFLPGMGWKKTLQYYRRTMHEMMTIPFDLVKARMGKGTAISCYLNDILESEDSTPERELIIKCSAASIYAGGADTSVSQIHGFFLLMMLNPQVQRKAQAEIDSVVGHDRLPDFSDRDNLVYVEAVLKEAARFHTVIPGGGARRAVKDDLMRGYLIPEDSIIIPNIWEMCHDPEIYQDPFEFNPDRFLGSSPELNPRDLVFGFGRRICPGMQLADTTTWICAAMTLALFDVKPTQGSPSELSLAEGGSFTGDPISRPSPFNCEIKPRSSQAEALIRLVDDEVE